MPMQTRKLTVTGNGKTYYVTLPRTIIKNLKWEKGPKKTVRQDGDRIVIEDWEEPA